MTFMRWTPGRDLLGFENEVNRLFGDLVAQNRPRALLPAAWVPAVDVHETEKEYTIELDLPGVSPADVKIQVTRDQLTIHGERRSVKDAVKEGEPKATTHRVERVTGVFERTFTLPVPVDSEQVQAQYKDGVLTIRLPKAAGARTRQVTIDVA